MIGAKGVERVVEVKMNSEEKAAFKKSVTAVRKLVNESNKIIKSSNEN